MEIVSLNVECYKTEAATLLVTEFKEFWPNAWPTIEHGLETIQELSDSNAICLAAIENEQLLGWIGATEMYEVSTWELHPLVVRSSHRHQGIGRALVSALENEVRKRNGITMFLGTDDESSMTSLSNTDLYHDLWQKIQAVKNYKQHPYEFYQRLGYTIVGVIPDANGIGKPDILMTKRLVSM